MFGISGPTKVRRWNPMLDCRSPQNSNGRHAWCAFGCLAGQCYIKHTNVSRLKTTKSDIFELLQNQSAHCLMCGGNGNLQNSMEKSDYALLSSLKNPCVWCYVRIWRAQSSTRAYTEQKSKTSYPWTAWWTVQKPKSSPTMCRFAVTRNPKPESFMNSRIFLLDILYYRMLSIL